MSPVREEARYRTSLESGCSTPLENISLGKPVYNPVTRFGGLLDGK
jgi:hypothetical protein